MMCDIQETMTSTQPNHRNDCQSVGIFWDIENCNIPKNKDVTQLLKVIRKRAIGDHWNTKIKEFECVCNTSKLCRQTVDYLNRDKTLKLIHVNTRHNPADNKLIQHIRNFIGNR
jgi:meiosis arrest female protein 1